MRIDIDRDDIIFWGFLVLIVLSSLLCICIIAEIAFGHHESERGIHRAEVSQDHGSKVVFSEGGHT